MQEIQGSEEALGNIFHYFISLSSFLFSFLCPIPLYLSYCLFFQILACDMFIPLVVLSQVKQLRLLPTISFCLANVTKRDFLAGMHLHPDPLPRTEACQKTTSLTEMQLHFTTFFTATVSFSGTQSTVHDACSLYTQPVRKRLDLSPILLYCPNPHKNHMCVVSIQTSFCGGPSGPTRGNPKPK